MLPVDKIISKLILLSLTTYY